MSFDRWQCDHEMLHHNPLNKKKILGENAGYKKVHFAIEKQDLLVANPRKIQVLRVGSHISTKSPQYNIHGLAIA